MAILIFSQQSCVKEYTDFDKVSKTVDYSPAIAGAVAHTKLTVRDIIRDYDEDELFTEDQTGLLFLMYDKEVFTEKADEFIFMPDVLYGPMDGYNDAVYNSGLPIESGYKRFPEVPAYYSFLVENSNTSEKLDSITFDILDLEIDVTSGFHGDGVLDIEFPMLKTSNGAIFTSTIILDGTGFAHIQENHHLENCKLVLDQSSGAPDNQIFFKLNLKILNGLTTNSGDKVSVNVTMKNMDFKEIYGYIGVVDMNVEPDTINISIFDNAFDGSVYFQDPSMTMYIDNSIGLPIRIYYDSLHTYSAIGNVENTYAFPGDDSLDINVPAVMGDVAETDITLDVDNFPEIRDLIYNQPKYLSFKIDAKTNPNEIIEVDNPNFIIDTSKVSVNLEVKLPLWGNALYSLVDTVKMDIEKNFEDISKHFVEANLRTIFDNFLPTNVYAQVVFTDSLYRPLDTLYQTDLIGERLIESAILDGNGRAQQAVKKTTDILFGNGPEYEHDINDLEHVKYAIVVATLRTEENGSVGADPVPMVRFYSDNYLEV